MGLVKLKIRELAEEKGWSMKEVAVREASRRESLWVGL
jgi:hypothetical protein